MRREVGFHLLALQLALLLHEVLEKGIEADGGRAVKCEGCGSELGSRLLQRLQALLDLLPLPGLQRARGC